MSDVRALLRGLQHRVMLSVARAVITLVNDTTKMQSLQVSLLRDELRDSIERFQQYGLTANPHPGAEGVVLFVGGNRDHGLCIAVDDRRYRLKGLAQGEVALYTDEGDKIHLKRNNVVEVTTVTFRVNASTKAEFNTPLATFTGDIRADGDILDRNGDGGATMADMRGVYNGHSHGGVQTGGGSSSGPSEAM